MAQLSHGVDGSVDFCEDLTKSCETKCSQDKRTSRIAEANWPKVVNILRQYRAHSPADEEKKQ